MTKRLKSKFHFCKRIHGLYKNVWGIRKVSRYRSIKLLKQNIFLVKKNNNRLTSFGRYLNKKQLIKTFYSNISEKRFQDYLSNSVISKIKTVEKFFSLLESKIDSILFRSCFANSLYMSRQLVSHGLILINNKKIKNSSFLVSKGDCIHLNHKKGYLHNKLSKILKQRRFRNYYLISVKTTNNERNFILQNLVNLLKVNQRTLTLPIRKILKKKSSLFIKCKKFKRIELVPNYLEVNFQIFKIVFLWEPLYKQIYYPIKIQYKKHSKNKLSNLNEILYNY
jgi:small subunit ribosomal protein S4